MHFLARKGLILITSLFAVITLTFFLMHTLPGDPFMQDQAIPEEVHQALQRHYGLDQPLVVQFGQYLNALFHFDLGLSFKYPGRTVNQMIADGFPVTFTLGLEALFLAVSGGILFGALAALYHTHWQDRAIFLLTVLGISIPSFLLATLLQYFLAMQLDIFPVARWGSLAHSIMPAITLAAFPLAYITRLTRTHMIEVLQQDYITTARSKGLSPFQIIFKHAARNALIPVIAYLGPLMASIFTGSFVIEKIFGIPGIGQWFVNSISNRDYPVIMGMTIFYSALLMGGMWLADIVYTLFDPRIRWETAYDE